MTLNKSLAGWGLLVVLGLNLRPILSSISPLLGEIRQATGLSFQSSALLTSLPVVCMGLVALVGVPGPHGQQRLAGFRPGPRPSRDSTPPRIFYETCDPAPSGVRTARP